MQKGTTKLHYRGHELFDNLCYEGFPGTEVSIDRRRGNMRLLGDVFNADLAHPVGFAEEVNGGFHDALTLFRTCTLAHCSKVSIYYNTTVIMSRAGFGKKLTLF